MLRETNQWPELKFCVIPHYVVSRAVSFVQTESGRVAAGGQGESERWRRLSEKEHVLDHSGGSQQWNECTYALTLMLPNGCGVFQKSFVRLL